MATPLAHKVTPVILAGFPVPVTVKVKDVILMMELLGLVRTACWTDTLDVPGSWLVLPGGLDPWEADTVTAVGVEVAVFTRVFVGVAEGVEEAVRVGVLVVVKLAVFVDVLVGVPVLTNVLVPVALGVGEAVEVGV